MIVKYAKNISSERQKKNVDDTKKIIRLMHDQIIKIYKLFKKIEKVNYIKEIEVYGVITSSK